MIFFNKNNSMLFLLFLALALPAFADTLEDVLGLERAGQIRSEGSLKSVQLKDAKTLLAPNSDFSRTMLAEAFRELEPNLIVETLYLFDKPELANSSGWTESERTNLYNSIRALSSLKGIEYYSASRKRMRTFYESSYVVSGEGETKAIPDPVLSSVPERDSLFAIQKDLTFGENSYRYDFRASSSGIGFIQENLSTMTYGFIPLLGKGKLHTVVIVLDLGPHLLVYAVSGARATLLPGIEGKVRDSFSNRADAIFGWFSKRADAALRK
ncbi:hypothetical protein MASR2M78_11110 [Treponema sp.]